VELVLRGDIKDGNHNQRRHWRTTAKLNREWKEKALLEWMSLGCPVFTGRVKVSFIAYRGRHLDYCNLHGSLCLKAAIDGLKGKAFTDDSPKYLEWGTVLQVTGKEYRTHPTLLMRIEAVEGEP